LVFRLELDIAEGADVQLDSSASNLVPGDTNGSVDVFIRDRAAETRIGFGPRGWTRSRVFFAFSSPDRGSTFECRLDAAAAKGWAACRSPKRYASLPDGRHTFRVRAIGPAGIADPTPASRAFGVAPPPNTKLKKARINVRRHRARFRFKATGRATGFRCKLKRRHAHQAARFKGCGSPKAYERLRRGAYRFAVKALGPGGSDPLPARKGFKIRPRNRGAGGASASG
jgi:hypothetical protein